MLPGEYTWAFFVRSHEGDFTHEVMKHAAPLRAQGYFVSQRDDLMHIITYKTTYGFIFAGHGLSGVQRDAWGRYLEGRIAVKSANAKGYDSVTPALVWRLQHHRFAFVEIEACDSAIGKWEATVATNGTAVVYWGDFRYGWSGNQADLRQGSVGFPGRFYLTDSQFLFPQIW
jgi:hypothetical protein